jgi:O-antigen/teichoic acid export membrane protein
MTAQAQSVTAGSYRSWHRKLSNLLSLRYLFLRSITAGGAVVGGLVQTFVFARVLTPREFSIYIVIGSFGAALWMFDLGAAKILYVRQRERHLARRTDDAVSAQSNAIVLLYALVVLAGAGLCFLVTASRPSITTLQALQYAAFFCFAGLNLVWFPLRNVSNAVDEFIAFETLESARRVGHIALMLALLLGLPFFVFLSLANLLWVGLFACCIGRLVGKNALARSISGCWHALKVFWSGNRREILSSANYGVGELAIYSFPYLLVPIVFGLGAPTIILDTVFKMFRGATLLFAAGLDPLVPRQTRAFAENDVVTLKKATWIAAALCAIPTSLLCAALLFGGNKFFALLLGHAATMPRAATFILVALLIGNLAHSVATCLLLHTGFFRKIGRGATIVSVAMAVMTGLVVVSGVGIIGFLGWYAAVYVAGAALYVSYMMHMFSEADRAPAVLPK